MVFLTEGRMVRAERGGGLGGETERLVFCLSALALPGAGLQMWKLRLIPTREHPTSISALPYLGTS